MPPQYAAQVGSVRGRDSQESPSGAWFDAWRSLPRAAQPVLRELVVRGPQSRTALARRLGLSPGSLTRLAKPLMETGLVVERAVAHDPVHGRPTRPLEVVAEGLHFLGFKITADGVYGVLTDLRARVVARESAPLMDLSPATVIAQIGELADTLVATRGRPPVAAGLTLGGDGHAPTPVGGSELLDSGLLGWEQVPLRRLASERLGISCVLENDVTALAHLQGFGDAGDTPDFALLSIGDGVGYALTVHGRPVRITEADIGLFGHQRLAQDGPLCPAGHRGCAVSYITTRAVVMAAAQGLGRFPAYEEVLDLAAAGDPVCSQAVRQAAWALGVLIATISANTTVKTVTLAGESAGIADAARADLESGITARRGSPEGITITVMQHDFHEWARGAAVVAIRDHISAA
jgi:predicted NBD/HSP70 family sugar kinase